MNTIELTGKVVAKAQSHNVLVEEFVEIMLEVRRKHSSNSAVDTLKVVYPVARAPFNPQLGDYIRVYGDVRTRNYTDNDGKRHTVVYVFGDDIRKDTDTGYDVNDVHLDDGVVVKVPTYRKTPNGRTISDLLIACARRNGKSSYIPTLAWGRYAETTKDLKVGDKVELLGRLQSRVYYKKFEDGSIEERVAYEISATCIASKDSEVAYGAE